MTFTPNQLAQQTGGKKLSVRKLVALIGAALFLVAVAAVATALIIGAADGEQGSSGDADVGASAGQADDTGDDENVTDVPEVVEFDLPPAEFGDDGLIPMVETDDPRVAAAAIARTLMSVDASKFDDADEFRIAVLEKVRQPSPEYVGLGEDTWYAGTTFPKEEWHSVGARTTEEFARLMRDNPYHPEGNWWRLGDSKEFSYLNGQVVVSSPVKVLDAEQMLEYEGEERNWIGFGTRNRINLKEGATLDQYWVQVDLRTSGGEYETGMGPDDYAVRHPVALAIYCDAPEEGGTCGLGSIMSSYPKSWQLQQ